MFAATLRLSRNEAKTQKDCFEYYPSQWLQYFLNRSNLDGASTGDNKAIELNPNYAEAYNNRGVTKAGKGDLKGILAGGYRTDLLWMPKNSRNPKLLYI